MTFRAASDRRYWLAAGSLVLLVAIDQPSLAQEAPVAGAPNVVFILSDDHRYDFMGFHPNAPRWLRTPNLDRMGREGAHLSNAFVSTSLCSPSRATILTGQYAHTHGVVDNRIAIPAGTRFFPEYLQAAGYRTAFIGKWHMGENTWKVRPGYDRWVSFRGQGVYYDPLLNVDGVEVKHEGYTSDLLTDYAIEFLEGQRNESPERPFFVYLSHKAVHDPFDPAERHRGDYAGVPLTIPPTMHRDADGIESWPEWVRRQRSSWHGVDYMYHGKIDYPASYRGYAETLSGVDESVGRVMTYLDENGLADNTLVIYMGDNGFTFGEHGLIDKRTAYEESMRVPMLAWAPGWIPPGSVVERNVVNIDVMPTVLDVAGVRAPESHVVHGSSFLPLLRGERVTDWRDDVLYEYYWEWNYPQTPTHFAIRTERYKYLHAYGVWDKDALFDLQNDPLETRNLIDSEEHQELAVELIGRLYDELERTGGMQVRLRRPSGARRDDPRPENEPSTDPLESGRSR